MRVDGFWYCCCGKGDIVELVHVTDHKRELSPDADIGEVCEGILNLSIGRRTHRTFHPPADESGIA